MSNVFDTLMERGYIAQCTHEKETKELLENESVSFYIGFDPTADSLHIGSFIQLMVMMHMQRAGHRPIALLGGGTAMVGDPTGKTDMRKMLTKEDIDNNANKFKNQFSRFIEFEDDKAAMVNNADWLLNLNYVSFLRDIGVHFSVNRMLTAECFKTRLEKGLSFLEFNYMLMQSYDFLELYRRENCKLQLGGDDQWSNIIGGVELIRRADSGQAFGMTFNLLLTSEGKKMGKTEKGSIWIDEEKTSPYELYQYLRNIDDADVEKCLSLLTFIPMDEVKRLSLLEGSEINKAKEVLAYETTVIIHGKEKADKALEATKSLFGGGIDMENVPSINLSKEEYEENKIIMDLMIKGGLIKSRGEGRRLIGQNGVSVNDIKVTEVYAEVTMDDLDDGSLMIKKGKKTYLRVIVG